MDQPRPPLTETIAEFARSDRGRRTIGVAVALALEALLLLMLLTLGISDERDPVPLTDIATFDVRDYSTPAPPEPEPAEARPETAPRRSALTPPPAPRPTQTPAAVIPVAPTPAPVVAPPTPVGPRPIQPVTPGARTYGPAVPNSSPNSQRVGTAPNGQPLYGAAWYRRPRDDEMRGYLSTATAGYATIACRTVPDFRVEDCVLEDEQPSGSQMGRAVMAMAWQFRIRPPMIGGQYQVGEWVRIRIYYDLQRDRFEY